MKTVEPFRRTKLIATVTEACSSYDSVRGLALAGVDVFRLTDGYEQMNTRDSTIFEKIRKASGEVSRKLATMLHFNEYEIGIRTCSPHPISFSQDDVVYITINERRGASRKNWLFCDNSEFPDMVDIGDLLYIDYGKTTLTVVDVSTTDSIDK